MGGAKGRRQQAKASVLLPAATPTKGGHSNDIAARIQARAETHCRGHSPVYRGHVGHLCSTAPGGVARFDYRVVLGGLGGAAIAVANFAGICFVVQKIIDEPDEKRRKAKLQLSHNGRMLMQAVWVVVAIAAPCFQPFASVLPLFFPRITIYYRK